MSGIRSGGAEVGWNCWSIGLGAVILAEFAPKTRTTSRN